MKNIILELTGGNCGDFTYVEVKDLNGELAYATGLIKLTKSTSKNILDLADTLGKKNRGLRTDNSNKIISAIKDQAFSFTGVPILMCKLGGLLDGFHRVSAVNTSDIPLVIPYVIGINDSSKLDVDQGAKRSDIDRMTMAGLDLKNEPNKVYKLYKVITNYKKTIDTGGSICQDFYRITRKKNGPEFGRNAPINISKDKSLDEAITSYNNFVSDWNRDNPTNFIKTNTFKNPYKEAFYALFYLEGSDNIKVKRFLTELFSVGRGKDNPLTTIREGRVAEDKEGNHNTNSWIFMYILKVYISSNWTITRSYKPSFMVSANKELPNIR